jgi:hypothetical protein
MYTFNRERRMKRKLRRSKSFEYSEPTERKIFLIISTPSHFARVGESKIERQEKLF